MAAPTFNIAETNGAGPTGTTTVVTSLAYASIDAASTGTLSAANPFTQGTNAFEKWWRLQVATIATTTISATSVYFSATAPVDSAASAATLSRFFAANATYATPTAATSTVAVTNCNTVTTAPGTTVTVPANTAAAYSGYVTMQLRSTAGAAGGATTFAASEIVFSYTWS